MVDLKRKLELLQHSLGVDQYGLGKQYRNYFATSPGGKDFDDCAALVAEGLMGDHGPHIGSGGMHYFEVTREGKQFVRENSPMPPKLTRSQKRYLEFMNSDCGMQFGEWLKRGLT